MRDAFGRKVKEGDQVIWSNRKGSDMWLSRGKVVCVYDYCVVVERSHPTPARRIILRSPRLMAVSNDK